MKAFDLTLDLCLLFTALIFGMFGMVQIAVNNYAHAAALFGLAWFNTFLVTAGPLARERLATYKKSRNEKVDN